MFCFASVEKRIMTLWAKHKKKNWKLQVSDENRATSDECCSSKKKVCPFLSSLVRLRLTNSKFHLKWAKIKEISWSYRNHFNLDVFETLNLSKKITSWSGNTGTKVIKFPLQKDSKWSFIHPNANSLFFYFASSCSFSLETNFIQF